MKAGSTAVRQDGARFVVDGVLRQVQAGAPFTADVPVLVQTERGVTAATVRLDSAEQAFSVAADGRPLALFVDPHFDVFRRLDPRETPPSIGQIFGEPAIVAVLPAGEGAQAVAAYRELLKGWQSDAHRITVVLDSELQALPADRAAWVIGRTNRLAPALFGERPGLRVDAASVGIDGETMPLAGHTLIATFRHPANVEKAVGWIVAEPAGGASRPRPQAPPLREVLVSRLPGRGTRQHHQGPVAAVRLADARGFAARGPARRRARRAAAGRPQGAGGPAARVLAAGARRARGVSRVARASGARPRQPGPRQSGPVRGGQVPGVRADARRRRGHVLPALHGAERAKAAGPWRRPT